MSVHVLSRFLKESRSELGSRLVGVVMSFAAGDDGICWSAQTRLMEETGLSESQIRRCIRDLERLHEIETRQAQRGRRRVNVYRLWCADAPDYDRLPFELREPFTSTTGHIDRRSSGGPTTGHPDADDRSFAPPTPSLERKRETVNDRSAWRVDRKTVTELEEQFAQLVLADWNARTGQSLTARDWLAMIVRRQRERPEFTVGELGDVLAANLAEPWWKGSPSPNIIFGSSAQFERALEIASSQQAGGDEVAAARSRFGRLAGGRQ